jgi:DNA-directed RNA polymerase subunit H (RpoH/RPB5)
MPPNPIITSQHIYNARTHLLNQLSTQGFDVSEYALFSMDEIHVMKAGNQMDMLISKKGEPTTEGPNRIYVHFCLNSLLMIKNIKNQIEDLMVMDNQLTKKDTLYVVYREDANDSLMNELKLLWESTGVFVIVENIHRLQYDITKHTGVPPHSIVPEDVANSEVQAIMKKYNIIDKNQFPMISRFDPVARAIGIRPGQLCRIIRPSKTAIQTDYYRLCI